MDVYTTTSSGFFLFFTPLIKTFDKILDLLAAAPKQVEFFSFLRFKFAQNFVFNVINGGVKLGRLRNSAITFTRRVKIDLGPKNIAGLMMSRRFAKLRVNHDRIIIQINKLAQTLNLLLEILVDVSFKRDICCFCIYFHSVYMYYGYPLL